VEPSTSTGLVGALGYLNVIGNNGGGGDNSHPYTNGQQQAAANRPKTRDTIMPTAQTPALNSTANANEEPLPPGWEMRMDPYGRRYVCEIYKLVH
jgi:hypothetical protein